MHIPTLTLAVACVLPTTFGATPQTDPPEISMVVRCGELWPGDGPALRDAWMVVRDGRIERTGTGAGWPQDLPVLDARDKVVMPGIVAADTTLSGVPDTDYNVTPDFMALEAFDFTREYPIELSGGVTSVYLGTGRKRLMPGQGAVVKLFGDDPVQRLLSESCSLHLTLGADSTSSPRLFEPTVSPTSDDPLEPARQQFPTARISQLATVRDLFDEAARAEGNLGEGSAENLWDPEPLRRVLTGELPLRIAAREARDILRALELAKSLGVRTVVENPWQLDKTAKRIADAGAMAVLQMPIALSGRNPGGENRRTAELQNLPTNPAIAAAAGLPFALAPNSDEDLADMLFLAAIAIRHGLPAEAAMRAITLDAARAIGVDQRVGSLRAGKDADFVVLSGSPFAVGTLVEQTFVDGALAFSRETDSELLAIRAGRVITAAGPVLSNATIIVGDGKIRAIGEELAIPYGARLIDMPDAIVTPGFIDSYSSLGLSGDGTGIPAGALDQRIDTAIRWDDEMFAPALAAGLTTAMVSGPDGSGVSGRVAAVKLGARGPDTAILRATAGLRIVHDVVGPDSTKQLAQLIDRGKKYIASWEKYEKDLAAWEAGKLEKSVEKKPEPKDPEAAASDPLSGTWECELSGLPFPVAVELVLIVELVGTKVTGKFTIRIDGNEMPGPPRKIENGRFKDGVLTGTVRFMGNSATLEAAIENEKLTGTIDAGNRQIEVSGQRTSKDTKSAAGDIEDDKPRAPNVDESLEPVRAWIEKKIPAIIRTSRAPAIKDVIAFFADKELSYMLQDVDDAIDTPAILGESPPPVLLGPELVSREKGQMVNAAAALADAGVALAFGTGDTAGSRYLPLHAAHAIRWGLDPQAALHGLTIEPAKMFGIDDRVGSLERGKDADLVVFSGNPFEPTSRVLLVVCDGQVVIDDREED